MTKKKDTRSQIRKALDRAGLTPDKLLDRSIELQWLGDENQHVRAECIFGKFEVHNREDGFEAWLNNTELGLYSSQHNAKLACDLHHESLLFQLLVRGIGADHIAVD